MSRYVIDLRSRDAGDARVAGGKGAGLCRLARQRFNVPPGFVITTLACRDFLATLDVTPKAGRIPAQATREALSKAILTAPIPSTIQNEVRSAYAKLSGSVAVRSSSTGEDAPAASHAGQFETLLDVTGEQALLEAVRACWASRFADRATSYLAQHGSTSDGAMAVVVQRMVPALAAGVAFSADPFSGQRHVIIEAAPGLGTMVAGGTVLTDRYVVDGRGVLAEVAPAVAGRPVLDDAEILHLARVVGQIEQRAGRPQDVEWAWDGAAFHILQSRPITALDNRHVFSSRIVSDMAPGLVKPMVYDVNTLATVREIFGALFGALLGTRDFDTSQFVARLHSRVYADMTVLGEKLVAAGLPPNLFEVMLRDERSNRAGMKMSPRLLGVSMRMVPLVIRSGRLGPHQGRQVREGRRNLEPFRTREWSTRPLPEVLANLDCLIARRDDLLWFYFCSVFNSAVRTRLLGAWVQRKTPDVAFGDLIRGLAGLKSLEPLLDLERLAELARGLSDETRAVLSEGNHGSVRTLLADSLQGRLVLDAVTGFLSRYGYLSSNGSDFSSPSWNENPVLIWRSIARGITSETAGQEASAAAIREAACDRVRASIGPLDRWVFGRLLAGATTAIEGRESTSVLISEYTHHMRRLFLAAGQQMTQQGRLAEVEDLFYLTRQELHDLAAGLFDPTEAAACIDERRAAMIADEGFDPPEVVVCIPGEPIAAAEDGCDDRAEYLSGIGGSPGRVHGFARVVRDPVEAPAALGRTDILVVPFSDVGWTPLFAGIGGIVAETGGQLSHAAIVAREYNLPAVVSVRDATRRICDGQPLIVDGNQGRVYLESLAA